MQELFERLDRVIMKMRMTERLPWIERCEFWDGLVEEKNALEKEIKKEMLDKAKAS